MIIYVCYW